MAKYPSEADKDSHCIKYICLAFILIIPFNRYSIQNFLIFINEFRNNA